MAETKMNISITSIDWLKLKQDTQRMQKINSIYWWYILALLLNNNNQVSLMVSDTAYDQIILGSNPTTDIFFYTLKWW